MDMTLSLFSRLRRALCVAAAVFSLQPAASFAISPEQVRSLPPDQLVSVVANDILESIRKDRSLQQGDIDRLNRLVDKEVLPVVNFTRMTALVVGPQWRSATEAQRQQLVTLFREQLTLQYSSALRLVADTTLQVKPLRMNPQDTDVIVRTLVVRSGKEPIQLDYRMQKTADGWKIYDFNVLGLWFIENYRQQFAQTVNASGIVGLITALQERNASLRAGSQKASAS